MEKKTDNGLIELAGYTFRRVKSGLDEEQVASFIGKLADERDRLASERDGLQKRQEHLSSLAQLAERTVAEADEVAGNIKEKATSEAENAAKAIIANAEEQAQQMMEEKKAEVMAAAQEEAQAIKASAQQQAEAMMEEKAYQVQSELRETAQSQYEELLSQLEGLVQQQLAASRTEFEKIFSQPVAPARAITPEESEASAEAEAAEGLQATSEADTGETEEKTEVSTGNLETDDHQEEVELEITAPVDIGKIMGIITNLEILPEVKNTELINQRDKYIIQVSLSGQTNFLETLKKLPQASEVKEIKDADDTEYSATDTGVRRRRFEIKPKKSVLDETRDKLNNAVPNMPYR